MQSLVSVIIPCYNGADLIDRSIESVYTQDYRNVELIVVDDGSTDNSRETILAWEHPFAQKGAVLKYIYQENRGLGGAIDTGLKYVTGRYLTLLDADDYYLPHSIGKKAQYLDAHPECAGVRSNGWMVCGEEKKLFITSEEEKRITDLFEGLFIHQTNNWAGSYMLRTELLFAFYPDRTIYPSRFGQNLQLLLPVAYKRRFGYIDEALMVYELHENSLSQAESAEKQWEKYNFNFYCYLDIYRHMLQSVIRDPNERAYYENRVNAWQYCHECKNAVRKQDKIALKNSFRALSSTGCATLNDKITFLSVLHPTRAVVYRILRRWKQMRRRCP